MQLSFVIYILKWQFVVYAAQENFALLMKKIVNHSDGKDC